MLQRPVLSIDIGTHSIKAVQAKRKKNIIELEKAFLTKTPANSCHDGELTDIRRIADVISQQLTDCRIKAKDVIFTIESTGVIIREIVLPKVKDIQLSSMVRFEVEKYLPIQLDEYIIEYTHIGSIVEDKAEKVKLLVAALPRDIAEAYWALAGELGLRPRALDIHANAIAKLFSNEQQINNQLFQPSRTAAFLDIGSHYINCSIVSKGIIHFNRLIPLGGKDIDILLASTYNESFESAEARKQSIALMGGGSSQSGSMVSEGIAAGAVDGWIQEVQRMLQFYTSRSPENIVEQVILYGGSSNLHGLKGYMLHSLHKPVEVIEVLSNVRLTEELKNISIKLYLNAIGAVIRKQSR